MSESELLLFFWGPLYKYIGTQLVKIAAEHELKHKAGMSKAGHVEAGIPISTILDLCFRAAVQRL